MKRFFEWIRLKEKLQSIVHIPPLVSEGDIWWVSIGENIGSEINGKSKLFSRPVIVHTKLTQEMFLIIPASTQADRGSWYVPYRHQELDVVACLHQIRVIDYRRLYSKLGTVTDDDFERIRAGFKRMYAG